MTTTTKLPAADRDERLLRLLEEIGDREPTDEENQRILDVAGFDVDAMAAKIDAEVAKIEAGLAANDAARRSAAWPAVAMVAPAAACPALPANDTLPPPDNKEARRHRAVWAVAAAVLVVAGLCAAGGGLIVAFNHWPGSSGKARALHVELPAEPVPAGPKAPRRPGPGR